MKIKSTPLFVLIPALFSLISGDSPICLFCHDVTNMATCKNITRCGQNEGCYTRETIDITGQSYYQAGCATQNVCDILQSAAVSVGKKRDLAGCYRCCHDNLCNSHICDIVPVTAQLPVTTQPPPTSTTPNIIAPTPSPTSCYTCRDTTNLTDCLTVKTCSPGQKCYTTRATLFGSTHYSLGCEDAQTCAVFGSGGTSVVDPFCKDCCNTSQCNLQLCGLHVIPNFTVMPRNRTVEIGDAIRLQCDADKAAITWTFESITGKTDIPKPTAFGPNNKSVFFEVTSAHFGKWTCVASNPYRNATATAYISHFSHNNN